MAVDQEILALAIQLTDDLNMESPPVQNQGTKAGQPHSSNYYMFLWEFKRVLGNSWPENPKAFVRLYWNEIGTQRQDKWGQARVKSVEIFKKAGGVIDKTPKVKRQHVRTERYRVCRYCNLKADISSVKSKHLVPIHYPECTTEYLEALLLEDVNNCQKKAYLEDFHRDCLAFFDRLHANPSTLELAERQEIAKYRDMFDDLMIGDATKTIYTALQLPDNFDELADEEKPKAAFRYCGQFSIQLRHLYVQGESSGNIGRAITELVNNRLVQFKSDGSDIPASMRLHFWYALKVPAKSSDVFEQAIIMALWHLCGRDSFWNQQGVAIHKGCAMRQANPADIVYLGLYAVHRLVLKLNEQLEDESFFAPENSVELFNTYDNVFTREQRFTFDKAYKTGSAQTVPLSEHIELINSVEELAEVIGDGDLLELIAHFRAGQARVNDEEMDVD